MGFGTTKISSSSTNYYQNISFITQISITSPAKKETQTYEEVRRTVNNNELSPQRETELGMYSSDPSQSQVNGPTKAIIKEVSYRFFLLLVAKYEFTNREKCKVDGHRPYNIGCHCDWGRPLRSGGRSWFDDRTETTTTFLDALGGIGSFGWASPECQSDAAH